MATSGEDHIPVFLLNKLASYQRGPQEASLLRGSPQSITWTEPLSQPASLNESGWLAHLTEPANVDEQAIEAAHDKHVPQHVSKYMLSYYQQPFGQRTDRDDSEMEDKVQELQQQTLAMQAQWHQQQAGMHAYAKRKVKVGIPFARPGPTHPKLVGAAGMVPNNMRKHNWKLPKAPDLTRDPSEPQTVHVPFHTGNSLLEREGAKRRQPIARLHCKAFQFPVLVHEKADRKEALDVSPLRHHREYQMLGSGFRVRRGDAMYCWKHNAGNFADTP